MNCPKCGSTATYVKNHRRRRDLSGAIDRLHMCRACNHRFTSSQKYDQTVEFKERERRSIETFIAKENSE